METRRQQIMVLLREEPISLQHIANLFKTTVKDIREDMKHIKYSMQQNEELMMLPAECKSCGYVFRERSKIKRPTKCPKCKHERIIPPLFSLKKKKKKH